MDVSLEDEREIHAVLVRYATGIDRRDWELFVTCFTADFAGDYGSFGAWTSAQAITQSMREMHAPLGPTLHRLTNVAISKHGSVVTSRSYVDALLAPVDAGGESHQGIGYYDDEWQRTDSGWRIRRRKFTLLRFI